MKNWITTICIFLFAITASISAQSAYMKFDGVDGEATDKDHKGWSDLASFSQGITRPSAQTGASGATRRRGSATLGDIVCTKELDKSSTKLAEAVCTGKVFPKVEIHLTRSLASGGRATYYTYELKNVLVTSYQISGSDDQPTEELSLNYEEIKVVYTEYDAQGRKKGNVEYTWKVEEGTK